MTKFATLFAWIGMHLAIGILAVGALLAWWDGQLHGTIHTLVSVGIIIEVSVLIVVWLSFIWNWVTSE